MGGKNGGREGERDLVVEEGVVVGLLGEVPEHVMWPIFEMEEARQGLGRIGESHADDAGGDGLREGGREGGREGEKMGG
jgi:hypothetical protein